MYREDVYKKVNGHLIYRETAIRELGLDDHTFKLLCEHFHLEPVKVTSKGREKYDRLHIEFVKEEEVLNTQKEIFLDDGFNKLCEEFNNIRKGCEKNE